MSTTSLTYSTYQQQFRLVWRRIDFSTIRSFKEESIDLRRKVRFNTGFASDLSFIRWKSSYDVTDPIEFWWPTTDESRELFKSYRFLTFIYFNIDFWILYWINNIVVLIYEVINIWIFISRFLSHFNERKVLRKKFKV